MSESIMGNTIPVRVKIAVVSVLLALFALTALGTQAYHRFTAIVEEEMGRRAMGIAQAAGELVQLNPAEVSRLFHLDISATRADAATVAFKQTVAGLAESNHIKFLYVETRLTPDQVKYREDDALKDVFYVYTSEDESDYSDEKRFDVMNALRERAYAEQRPVFGPLTNDPEWGMFITGYAPLLDSAGQLLGLVGVDIEAAEAFALFGRVRGTIMLTSLLVLLAIAAVGYQVGRILERPALIDGLTELYNHRTFQERLEAELGRAKRHAFPLSLVLLDVDHFKCINDTHGHPFGDQVLREISRLLRMQVRRGDLVARYGGEEFALILPHTDRAGAAQFVGRIMDALRGQPVTNAAAGVSQMVTLSAGIAAFVPGQEPVVCGREELIRRADAALYAAKGNGRNRFVTYDMTTTAVPSG